MSRRFIIIGAGTGQAANLTETARQALMDATCVFAAPRLAEQLGGLRESQAGDHVSNGGMVDCMHAISGCIAGVW